MADSEFSRASLLTKYRDSMQELQETLVNEKKWRLDAENENRVLRKKNLEIEEQITDFRYSAVEYMGKIEELTAENKKLYETTNKLALEIEKLDEMHEREQAKVETLNTELEKMEEIVSELKSDNSKKQRIIEDWKTALIRLEEQLKVLENDNLQLKKEMAVYQSAYKEFEYTLQAKKKECKDLYENFKVIDEENNRLRKQEESFSSSQVLLEKKTQQLVEDEKKLSLTYKNKLISANETIEKMKIEKDADFEVIEELKSQNAALNEKCSSLKGSKDSLDKSFKTKVSELENNLSLAQEQSKGVLEKNNFLEKEVNKLKDQINTLIKDANALKSEIHAKNETIFEISNQNKDLTHQLQTLSESIELEKVQHAKEIASINQKNEKSLASSLKQVKSEHIEELKKIGSVLQLKSNDYIDAIKILKEKEEENKNINKDREILQQMVRELEKKLREVLDNSETEKRKIIQLQSIEDKQIKAGLENKYNNLLFKFKESENQYEQEIDTLSSAVKKYKKELKDFKQKADSQSEHKIKLAEDNVSYWREKFREEVGYLEKWAESIQGETASEQTYNRVRNMIKRLVSVLDHIYV
jgi:chromosome segregation ATPase